MIQKKKRDKSQVSFIQSDQRPYEMCEGLNCTTSLEKYMRTSIVNDQVLDLDEGTTKQIYLYLKYRPIISIYMKMISYFFILQQKLI